MSDFKDYLCSIALQVNKSQGVITEFCKIHHLYYVFLISNSSSGIEIGKAILTHFNFRFFLCIFYGNLFVFHT